MSLSSPAKNIKQKIMVALDDLPTEGLQELETFLDYIHFKFQKPQKTSTPYKPVALGGLWKNENIDEKDINEIRREMWNHTTLNLLPEA
jgi:hypothetical protein